MAGKNYKRKKFLIDKNIQRRFAGLLVMVALITSLQLVVYILVVDNNIHTEAAKYGLDEDPVLISFIIVQQKAVLVKLIVLLFVNMGLMGLFGLFFSHRITGPIYRINRFLKEMVDGDLSGEIRLRKSDEFQNVAATINDLLKSLRTDRVGCLEKIYEAQNLIKQQRPDDAVQLLEEVRVQQQQMLGEDNDSTEEISPTPAT